MKKKQRSFKRKAPDFALMNKVAHQIVFTGEWAGQNHEDKTNIYNTKFHFTGSGSHKVSEQIYRAMRMPLHLEPLKVSEQYFNWLLKQEKLWIIELNLEVTRAMGSKEIVRSELQPSQPLSLSNMSEVINREHYAMRKEIGVNDTVTGFFWKAGLERPTLQFEFGMVS